MKTSHLVEIGLMTFLALVLAFMMAPEIFVIANSFNPSEVSGQAFLKGTTNSGVTLRWYESALHYAPFARGLVNSLIVASMATALAVIAGSLASVAITRYRFRGRETLRGVLVSPMAFPRVALGLGAYIFFLRGTELLNIREAIIGTPLPLGLVHSLLGLPLVIVIVSAALAGQDPALEEAAMDLGATTTQTLLRVTFPLARVGITIAAVFAFMFSFDEVEASFFIAPVSGRTLPIEMFVFMEQDQSPTVAALSTLLMLGTALVLVVFAVLTGWRRLFRVWIRE